jgi:hypothetical protein
MIAMVNEQRLQRLADECLHISERTEDARTASELLKLSHHVLELATPSLPVWKEEVAQRNPNPWRWRLFGW